MAQDRAVKLLHFDVAPKMLDGAKQAYDVVKTTYGPLSGNVGIEKNWGRPVLTHDGVTAIRDIDLEDPVANMAVQFLKEASEKTNDLGGDGTSCTVILGYHIFEHAYRQVAAGANPMEVRRGIERIETDITGMIKDLAVPVNDEQKLIEVATISAGDKELGMLIAKTIIEVGEEGGVTVEEFEGLGVEQEITDGFYFNKGFHSPYMATNDTGTEANYTDISILVVEKTLSTNSDIVGFLENMQKQNLREIMIIGDVQGDALATLALNKMRGAMSLISVPLPAYGDQRTLFLEDVALLTGARPIYASEKLDSVSLDDLGVADRVIVNRDSTTIVGGRGDEKKVKERIKQIKGALKEEDNEFYRERYGQRIGRLSGKIGLIRVGGATETEMKERKFRVDDAVNATKAARDEGIVPGGGKTLVNISKSLVDLSPGGQAVLKALVEPFRQLQLNAGHNADFRLGVLLERHEIDLGYDVQGSDEPIDLLAGGVIDPAKVIRLAVENACSFAKNAITTRTALTHRDGPKEAEAAPQ